MSEGESTFRPALLLMAGRAVAAGVTLLIPLALVRVFSQEEFGTYKQLFLVFTVLYSVALAGLSDSLYYFIPAQPHRAGRYLANAIVGLWLAGLTCLAALHGAREAIADGLGNPALAGHLDAIGAFLLFSMVATVLEIALIARKRYPRAAAAYLASDLVRAACLLLPAVLLRDLGALLAGAVAFAALRAVAALVLLRQEFAGDLRPDAGLLRAQVGYALPFALYVLVEVVQASYHQVVVSRSFDAATFALYAVGCFQVPLVDFLATPASSVMMVRLAEELREGRTAAALAVWRDVTRKLALLFVPLALWLAAFSREVITLLFTDAYAASAPIFALWVAGIALQAAPTDGVMRALAQVPFLFQVNLGRLAAIVILLPPLLAVFGLQGPVLATLLGLLLAKACHLLRLQQVMHLRGRQVLPWADVGGAAVAGTAALVPAKLLAAALVAPTGLVLAAGALVFAVAYGGLLVATGLLQEAERDAFTRWLRPSVPAPTQPAAE